MADVEIQIMNHVRMRTRSRVGSFRQVHFGSDDTPPSNAPPQALVAWHTHHLQHFTGGFDPLTILTPHPRRR
jgi:hypothetical protein